MRRFRKLRSKVNLGYLPRKMIAEKDNRRESRGERLKADRWEELCDLVTRAVKRG